MAGQTIKCVLCSQILAVVVGIPGKQTLKNPETIRIKKLDDDGTVIICPKWWALIPVHEDLLKVAVDS
jgi:hypothetical protein